MGRIPPRQWLSSGKKTKIRILKVWSHCVEEGGEQYHHQQPEEEEEQQQQEDWWWW
jgi:hypothetical protein